MEYVKEWLRERELHTRPVGYEPTEIATSPSR